MRGPRLLLHVRHRDRQEHAFRAPDRRRVRDVVRPPSVTGRGARQVRRRRRPDVQRGRCDAGAALEQ